MRCFRAERLAEPTFGRLLGRWLWRTMVPGCAVAGMVCLPIRAQQTSRPTLQHRSQENRSQAEPGVVASASQPSSLPPDVWGGYAFDHSNDSIELDLDRNKLSGYITRLGDAETDSNTPLTFFFDQSFIDGGEIGFQTRVVHGVWYSFRGTIVRGDGRTRADEGYYVLRGVLATHYPESGVDKSANETIEQRQIQFKSEPE